MPTISEPIKAEELPNDVELLHEYIITLAYVKNGVIEARDTHVANLLSKVVWLEGRLQWYKDRLAAAEGGAPSAPANAAPFAHASTSERVLSPHTPSSIKSPTSVDTPRLSPLAKYEPASRSPWPLYSPGYEEVILPSIEEEEITNETGRRTSPASSTRSQTSGPSRVSKKWKRAGRSGKSINEGKRDYVRRWSEGDRFDWG